MAVAEGIYVGSAAEISGVPGGEDINGLTCQVLEHLIDSGKCSVMLTTGVTTEVETQYLKPPSSSFDVMLGPCQQVGLIGEEISRCIYAKGFCVVKVCQETAKTTAALEAMSAMEEEGKLQRLPEAVEAGYFGTSGAAKVCWLTGTDGPKDAFIKSSDDLLASIVDSIMPSSLDTLGGMIESRSPALVGVTLQDAERSEYPYPSFDDKALYDYLQTYRSGLLRAVFLMGPDDTSVSLKAKESSEYSESTSITASAGTIVLYKPKCFEFGSEASSTCLSITATFMSKPEAPSLVAIAGEGSPLAVVKGAKAPSKPGATISNSATRMVAGYNDTDMYGCGLAYGTCCSVEFPFARFDWLPYFDPDPATALPWMFDCKHMGYVEGLEYFDNKYFSLPAAEVATMDTMHRHVLETGAMNLYKMGITKKIADKGPHHAGVAVALDKDDWASAFKDDAVSAGGNNVQAILANRFSYTFNLRGASFAVDTACSSSLTACHMGKQFLMDRGNDNMDFYLAIGLHQCLAVNVWMGNSQIHMFSSVGRCATFNDTADGYLRADNCSGVVMKYQGEDEIAKFRGSMVGQNGRAVTLTAPNGLAQQDVIWKACRDGGAEPPEGTIWSCHGTGTSLGDPIELGAVRTVQNKLGRAGLPVCISTNKVNTGHSEGGAAMTSVIAMIIQLGLQRMNGNIHLATLNPHIDNTNFDSFWNTELGSTNASQCNGHVSSFGFGGTNTHCMMFAKNQKIPAMDASADLLKRFSDLAYPEVRVLGNDPDEWEFDGFDAEAKSGDKYSVKVTESSKKYVLLEAAVDEDMDETDVAYSIQGNFGDAVPMEDGMVPGMKNVIVEVPESGEVEFSFCQTCKSEVVLAPKVPGCFKKSAPCVVGEGLTNMWRVPGAPGSELRIDLFISNGMYAVSWAMLDF